ncbi:S-4TM family putative pore-forming effector [Lentzea sp. NPDC034063]|uniref:S-4TM family putative pore-forming effector n=1 Tax=unclassified Lentzea TaxID=2643253 RepID=UPI0033D0E5C4
MNLTTNPEGFRGMPPRAIHERQLDDDMVLVQRAAAASHVIGQRLEATRVNAPIIIALGGVLVTLIGHGRAVMSVIGVASFLLSALWLKSKAARTAKEGATLQEMFDTALFDLPWRSTVAGDRIPEQDVRLLARKLPVGGEKDGRITGGWYDPTTGVHHPYDVFISQEQNLAWDARLRRRYSRFVAGVAAAWTVLGVVICLIVPNVTLLDTLLSFFVPSLAAFQIAYEIWSGQRKVADEREHLGKLVLAELRNAHPGPIAEDEWHRLRGVARDVQDGVFRTRLEPTRVPEWFYKRFRDDDEWDFGDTAEGHRIRLAERTTPPT